MLEALAAALFCETGWMLRRANGALLEILRQNGAPASGALPAALDWAVFPGGYRPSGPPPNTA